jgi:hypothetical protein
MKEFTYWKVKFDDVIDGIGYLKFNSSMEQVGLFDENGAEITIGVSYHPIEFENVIPSWDA